jgi:type IV secretory pathway protease TraF
MLSRVIVALTVLLVFASAVSCGDGTICIAIMTATPVTSTASSSAPPPGNTVTFFATSGFHGTNCPLIPQIIGNVDATWTTSDTTNVSIVNQKTQIGTNGVATCLASTPTPAIITATSPEGKKSTATLTCQ